MSKDELIALKEELEAQRKKEKYAFVFFRNSPRLSEPLSKEEILEARDTDAVVSQIESTLEKTVRLMVELGGDIEIIDLFCLVSVACKESSLSQLYDSSGVLRSARLQNLPRENILDEAISVEFVLQLNEDDIASDDVTKKMIYDNFQPIIGIVDPRELFDKLTQLGYIEKRTFEFFESLPSEKQDFDVFDIHIEFKKEKENISGENVR